MKSDNSVPARLAPNGRDYWTQVILGDGKRGWMRSGSLSALASDGCSL